MKNLLTNTTNSAYKGLVFWTFFGLAVFSVAYAASISSTTDPTVTSWDSITANWYQDVNDKLGGISVSDGNVGIWATPNSTVSGYTFLNLGSSSWINNHTENSTTYFNNVKYIPTGVVYKNTDKATSYTQNDWIHYWRVAPSWTADTAITWKNAMTIDNGGNVWIWTTSPGRKFHVKDSAGTVACFESTSSTKALIEFWDATSTANPNIWVFWDNITFSHWWTERMRIDSTGNVWIWTTTPWYKLEVQWDMKINNDPWSANLTKHLLIDSNWWWQLRLWADTDHSWIQSHKNQPLYINELWNNTIINPNWANVWIWTTDPNAKLDINWEIHTWGSYGNISWVAIHGWTLTLSAWTTKTLTWEQTSTYWVFDFNIAWYGSSWSSSFILNAIDWWHAGWTNYHHAHELYRSTQWSINMWAFTETTKWWSVTLQNTHSTYSTVIHYTITAKNSSNKWVWWTLTLE